MFFLSLNVCSFFYNVITNKIYRILILDYELSFFISLFKIVQFLLKEIYKVLINFFNIVDLIVIVFMSVIVIFHDLLVSLVLCNRSSTLSVWHIDYFFSDKVFLEILFVVFAVNIKQMLFETLLSHELHWDFMQFTVIIIEWQEYLKSF